MKVEVELPEIEGYEYTGEYRAPKKGEWYFFDGELSLSYSNHKKPQIIIRKVEPSLVGMLCELWDDEDGIATIGVLVEVNLHNSYPYETNSECWKNARPLSSSEVLGYLESARELDGGEE